VSERPEGTPALVGFAGALRERGLRVSPAEVARFQAAVGVLPRGDAAELYWAGRACFAVPPPMVGGYDTVFAEYFLGAAGRPAEEASRGQDSARAGAADAAPAGRAPVPLDLAADDGTEGGSAERDDVGMAASAAEVLRVTPFAACTPEELALVAGMVRRLRARPPERPGRRMRPAHRAEAIDLRATARRAMRTQGELIRPAWRGHRRRPRRIVILLDVSRSMAVNSRLLLHFAYAVANARRGVEVVCFGTHLTRITGLLRSRRSARALEAAAMSVLDWHGGTRIADAVGGLRAMRSVRGALRGAVVVICSDGLEQGDCADLGRQMYLLRRTCHQVIWLNPLAGDPRYQPIARGMRASLPYVDLLMAADTVAALEAAAWALAVPADGRRAAVSGAGRPRPFAVPAPA
jgi:uncharacterized protein